MGFLAPSSLLITFMYCALCKFVFRPYFLLVLFYIFRFALRLFSVSAIRTISSANTHNSTFIDNIFPHISLLYQLLHLESSTAPLCPSHLLLCILTWFVVFLYSAFSISFSICFFIWFSQTAFLFIALKSFVIINVSANLKSFNIIKSSKKILVKQKLFST